jgi:hypothetical protein
MAFDATVAGPSATSYATIAEADAYFNSLWSVAKTTAWQALRRPQKERLLISATNILETIKVLDRETGGGPLSLPLELRDDVVNYVIQRFDEEQRLQFPRNIDLDTNDNAIIPDAVKEALFEQAIYMTSLDEDTLAAQLTGIAKSSIEAGSARLYTSYTGNGNAFAPMAVALMRPYIRKTRRLNRG